MKITAKQLRQKYLDFFKEKGHTIISGASLIPENDPTVLFTTAGMHPLVPYLLGEKHPGGKRLVDVQKCLRTDDIDEVGDAFHHTFFEMLGNWSLGDPDAPDGIGAGYFKKEAIEWSLEFLTSSKWLGLSKDKLAVSVFVGDNDAPFDKEAFDVWISLGMPEKRIAKLPKKNNWWGPAGQSGPCGPDTEMFYWTGQDAAPESFDAEDARWVEIWNDVFMQYNKKADGSFELLKQQNVDTGMGMERTLAVLNGFNDNYKTELFWPIIEKIESISGKKYGESEEITRAMRIIADHLRSAVFVLAEGLEPSNTERGYVLRRLIRRAVTYGKLIDIKKEAWTKEVAEVVVRDYQETYPELNKNINQVMEGLEEEESKFRRTLEQGLKILKGKKRITGREAFDLFQSYGFPIELTREFIEGVDYSLTLEEKIKISEDFNVSLKKHQELSRIASVGVFKGGLQDHSGISTKYHTATHLLQAALRRILGDHIYQKGSNITGERMRFDFPHPKEITQEELKKVEDLVNRKIKEGLPVHSEEMELERAKQAGALGVFESKYGEKVKVYFVGPSAHSVTAQGGERSRTTSSGQARPEDYFSIEICGGPHVENTGEIGGFKIQKCESIGQGVKRIRAVVV